MTIFDFMGEHPVLTFFLAWLVVCAIENICSAVAARGKED